VPADRVTTPVPGPARRGRLPDPMLRGVIPPEDNRLWMFTPRAITAGERWIQDDTREWFEQNERKVVICRSYPTHPRWTVGAAADTARARIYHEGIVSEVHMLVRLTAGLPEVPSWVPARLSLKQAQADLAYRLTKSARGVFVRQGEQAMKDFAERAPGQFLKWLGATFVPKQIEQNVTVTPGQSLDPQQAEDILQALDAELKRRADEAKLLKNNPTDFEAALVSDSLKEVADRFTVAVGDNVQNARALKPEAAYRLNKVIDLEADLVDPVTGEIQWD
jgi:hypothetical protein